MPIVNGHQTDTGCYVEGHWGQYGPDHLADQAEGFGWEPAKWSDDPRVLRDIIDTIEGWGYAKGDISSDGVGIVCTLWEAHSESATDIETWLNDHTLPVCPHCGGAMYPTSDGFYRHLDYIGGDDNCEFKAIDTPVFYYWSWEDGEFYLWPVCDDEDCDSFDHAHTE